MSENSILDALIIQEAESLGIADEELDKYLAKPFEEKEAYLKGLQYFNETGKDRL